MSMTREQLAKAVDEAVCVYVVTEISPGNPVRVWVEPSDIKNVLIAEGSTLGNKLTVLTEEHDGSIDPDSPDKPGFDLIIGGDDDEVRNVVIVSDLCPSCESAMDGHVICPYCAFDTSYP